MDISALCLKSGNAAILRGGKEAAHTNQALAEAITAGCERTGIPQGAVQLIQSPDRALVKEMLTASQYIDMIIPRGGASLHQFALDNATIPVITGGIGICHIYVDQSADPAKVIPIVHNAKVQRPTVCNALDTVLIHSDVAEELLPKIADDLAQAGVELRCEPRALEILIGHPAARSAGPNDFDTEFLSLVLAIKVVDSLDEAIDHIYHHSTHHSDAIITEDYSQRHALCGRGGLGRGVRQRQHPLHRRRPVWAGGRGGGQHPAAARPRPDGAEGADDVQVGGVWRRASEGVVPQGTARRYRHHVVALLGYLALTLLMTYPLARELGRAIPGDGFDGWQNVWNLWWVKRALLVEGTNPYFTRFIDYPNGVYLYFHTLNIFNGLTFLPFSLNAGLLVAYDAAAVFSFVAGGYGAYLLALYVIEATLPKACSFREGWRHHAQLAAFVGGAIFTFSPYHMAHLLGHMQLISLEWIPFYALFVLIQIDKAASQQISKSASQQISKSANQRSAVGGPRPARRSRGGQPSAVSRSPTSNLQLLILPPLFLVLIAACDWYYAFYMALFTGLYLLWTIWRRRTWLRPALDVAATGVIFVLATSPVLVPMIRESLTSNYMVPPADSVERLSADLTAFVTPSELHPVWGGLVAGWANGFTATTSERTVFAGYSVLALTILALWTQRRAAGFWGVGALAFAVLALGPVLHVGGQPVLASGPGPKWPGLDPFPCRMRCCARRSPSSKSRARSAASTWWWRCVWQCWPPWG